MDVIAKPLPLSRPLSDSLLSRSFAGGLYLPSGSSAPAIPSLLNAQKLSLPANTPLGTRVKVSDGFVVSGAGADVNDFWIANGTYGGHTLYTRVKTGATTPGSGNICFYDTDHWELENPDGSDNYTTDQDVTEPWLASSWSNGSSPNPTLTHPAVQELTAPSTAQGGVFVSGGSQDGIWTKQPDQYSGKDLYGILGTPTDGESTFSVRWISSSSIASITGLPAWEHLDEAGVQVYYSLSDVATPDLAGSDKVTMWVDGVLYSKRGTFNGKSYYNVIGESTSTSLSAIFWSSATWHITNAIGVDLDTSTSAVATPDLATFLLGTVVTNTAWLNASDDSLALITVTSLTQGELNAGVLVAGAGRAMDNGTYVRSITVASDNSAALGYSKLPNGDAIVLMILDGPAYSTYVGSSPDYYNNTVGVAFPWLQVSTWTVQSPGTPPAPTVSRDDVASEANWSIVP